MLDAVISVMAIGRPADCLLCFCNGLKAVLTAFLFKCDGLEDNHINMVVRALQRLSGISGEWK